MLLHIGIDDTDSPRGGCTTYITARLVEELLKLGAGFKDYPNLLVTTGLHDSQVQYFEPAKWVAKLRAMKTDDNRLLLKTNMEAGHGGASGRYKRYEQIAFQYAFMFDLVGITE